MPDGPSRRWSDERLDDLARDFREHREDAKDEHESLEKAIADLRKHVDQQLKSFADEVRATRLTPKDILVYTSPILVALIGVIGLILTRSPS